jgi:SAM-dependent methyltransferase
LKYDMTDEQWRDLLLESVSSTNVNGIEFPSFPDKAIQANFVGSAYEHALQEAFWFYKQLKLHSPLNENSKVLDFGCGWGRFLRFFMKDVSASNVYGVDVDPDILEICRVTGVPGELSTIESRGVLPFPDDFFDTVMAYSVFTHLPEDVHHHWLKEITRVTKPKGIFCLTLESIRFLEFIEGLQNTVLESEWHKALAAYGSEIRSAKERYNNGGFVYFPTGGGDYRAADVYGDAVVPLSYVEKHWSDFDVVEYIDDANRFWQAVAVCRRK